MTPLDVIRLCAMEIHSQTGADVDDLVSAGGVAYVLAERSFDASKGCSRIAWLKRCVRWAMLDDVRKGVGQSRDARERFAAEQRDRVVLDTPERLLASREVRTIVRRVVRSLPPVEGSLIIGVDMSERNMEDVAASFGLSKSWGSRVHKRARALVTKRLRACASEILGGVA